jgi:antirestriction protein ArdC
MKRDDATRVVDDGIAELNEALACGRSETLERYLAVMSRFHRYSFGNLMLILSQREDATHVAGYRKWLELGRHVRQGEKGIGILAPCRYKKEADDDGDSETREIRGFRVVYVFDVSQTDGEPLAEFAAVTGHPGPALHRLEEVARRRNISVEYVQHLGGALGTSAGGTVSILDSLEPPQRFMVLCHEVGHEALHQGLRKHETTKTVRETEAEAVAFVVSRAIGLDCTTRSADYIQLYRGTPETLAESLHFVQRTAAALIEELDAVERMSSQMESSGTDEPTPIDSTRQEAAA